MINIIDSYEMSSMETLIWDHISMGDAGFTLWKIVYFYLFGVKEKDIEKKDQNIQGTWHTLKALSKQLAG